MTQVAVALLCALCIGFLLGRISGYQDGRRAGEAFAPLQLRAVALEQGRCPVCDQEAPVDVSVATTETEDL